MVAGLNYAAATVPTPPPSGVFVILDPPEGGWLMTTRPKAWYSSGSDRTYFCYVKGDSGDVRIAYWDHATEEASSPVTLHSALQADTHAAPSMALRQSDDKIMAFYCRQVGGAFYKRLSTSADDSSAFDSEVDLDTFIGGSAYTYPMIFELGTPSPNEWHLWYRSGNATRRWARVISSDDGATWTAGQAVVDMSDQSYIIAQKTSESRIDFLGSNGSPGTDTDTSIFHFYYEGGSFFETDGTTISASLPFDETAMTQVYNGAGNEGARAVDVRLDGTDVVGLFYVFNDATDAEYRWARWNGSAWSDHLIDDDAKFASVDSQTGGACLDPTDPTRVYCSRDISGTMEMFVYVTADDGASFTPTSITSSSSSHQHTPTVPVNRDASLKVLWMTGAFVGAADYTAGISGSDT